MPASAAPRGSRCGSRSSANFNRQGRDARCQDPTDERPSELRRKPSDGSRFHVAPAATKAARPSVALVSPPLSAELFCQQPPSSAIENALSSPAGAHTRRCFPRRHLRLQQIDPAGQALSYVWRSMSINLSGPRPWYRRRFSRACTAMFDLLLLGSSSTT